ncbi:MAG: hypothetical protein ACJA1A_001397 [Saprospiraceae bacterium]|jgi:hypothetical protein
MSFSDISIYESLLGEHIIRIEKSIEQEHKLIRSDHELGTYNS